MELPPDGVIKARHGHAAGVAVQSIGGGHGVAHGIDRLLQLRRFDLHDRLAGGGQQTGNVEATCHHQNPAVFLAGFSDTHGHMGLPGQTPVLLQFNQWCILPDEPAVGVHQIEKGFRGQEKPLSLKIFLPEFLEIPDPGLFAEPGLEPAVGQIPVRGVAELFLIGPQAPGIPGGQEDLAKAQVHESGRNSPISRLAQGNQLRGGIEEGIPAPPGGGFLLVGQMLPLVPAGVVEGHRGLGLRVRQDLQKLVGILRTLHQNAVRFICFNGLFQMPCTDGAVVPDGKIEDRPVHAQRSRFRAS